MLPAQPNGLLCYGVRWQILELPKKSEMAIHRKCYGKHSWKWEILDVIPLSDFILGLWQLFNPPEPSFLIFKNEDSNTDWQS